MYTPRTSVEAIPNASIHHSALQNRDFGHTYDRSRALVRALVIINLVPNSNTRLDPLIDRSVARPLRSLNTALALRV